MSLLTDPRDLLLGDDNDLVIGADLSFTSGLVGVAQDCGTACRMVVDDWFLDLDNGIDFLGEILGQRQEIGTINARAAFRQTLLNVPNVITILELDTAFEPGIRQLTVDFLVATLFGDVDLSLTFFGGN